MDVTVAINSTMNGNIYDCIQQCAKLISESGLGTSNIRCKIMTAYIFYGEMKDQLKACKQLKILKIPKSASKTKNCYEFPRDNFFCLSHMFNNGIISDPWWSGANNMEQLVHEKHSDSDFVSAVFIFLISLPQTWSEGQTSITPIIER